VKKETAPILAGEDRGRAAVLRRFVDYARMRRRPSVLPEGNAVVIDIDMGIGELCIEGIGRLWGEQARADTKNARRAAGRSRFSICLTWLQ
jgi:hypothetical protein